MHAATTNVSELLREADRLLAEAAEQVQLLDPLSVPDGRVGVLAATVRHRTYGSLDAILRHLDGMLAEDWGEPI